MTINFINFSRSVVVIDWAILTVLLLSSRMLLKAMRTLFFKTLVTGERSLLLSNRKDAEEIRSLTNELENAKVMGVIAENETGQNIGLFHDIEACIRFYAIDSLYLDMKSLSEESVSSLKNRIEAEGIKLHVINLP